MFIKVTQSGGRRYAQLVESFRNDAGQPRQRTLATLGRLTRVRHQIALFGLERSSASIESSTYGADSQLSVVAHGSV